VFNKVNSFIKSSFERSWLIRWMQKFSKYSRIKPSKISGIDWTNRYKNLWV